MVFRCLSAIALVGACRDQVESAPAGPEPIVETKAIEVRDAQGVVTARVMPGHPCRAMVDGVELLVGGRPLIAQHGDARWTGEDAANGTTLRRNDVVVARIHANQLFDADGAPILRITEAGDITSPAGAVVAHAAATPAGVKIGDVTVTHTAQLALAAMLTAQAARPEVRALAACHYLMPTSPMPTAKAP